MSARFTHLLTGLLLGLLPGLLYAAPQVSVSIKPVHSLVSAVMQGIGEPQLVLKDDPDPHHFSLKPSQRRMLAQADLVVWVSEELEASLAKAITQGDAVSLQLMNTNILDFLT